MDLGHIDVTYDWFLMGATQVVSIPGKRVYEADAPGQSTQDATDRTYLSQIIAKFV